MKNGLRKYSKIFLVCIGVLIVLQLTFLSGIGFGRRGSLSTSSAVQTNQANDDRIASEISNMSGVSKQRILKLRHTGKTWNAIIDFFAKNGNRNQVQSGKTQRAQALAENGLDPKFIQKMKDEGFSRQDIMNAKLLAERTLFQLHEISQSGSNQAIQPSKNATGKTEKPDLSAYQTLSAGFNEQTAVYLMLKLKKDFGSIEKVLNEYLLSLQLKLNLANYLVDKKKYLKDKEEKSAGIQADSIITLDAIDHKLLQLIQQQNNANRELDHAADPSANPGMPGKTQGVSPLPDVPKPNAQDLKPKNPTAAVMNEIKQLDPNGGAN